jgi:hypothetical protein
MLAANSLSPKLPKARVGALVRKEWARISIPGTAASCKSGSQLRKADKEAYEFVKRGHS